VSDAAALAFDRLLAEHGSRVLRVCYAILLDRHLSEDAAQEAFLRLWGALRAGRAPGRPAAWLNAAALSASIDIFRRRDVQARTAERRARALPVRPEAAGDPGAAAQAAELRRRLERALLHLPPGQRTVFLLRHEGGLPLASVAEVLGLALPTVKTQFARACLKLQSLLQSFGPETLP